MKETMIIEIVESNPHSAFVIHEKFERRFSRHQHSKGQLSYVEGGIAYVTFENQTFVVPAKHFIWIPKHTPHQLKVSHSATQLHSIYFPDDEEFTNPFYEQFGIYPANELIISLIKFTERWNEQFVNKETPYFELVRGLYHILSLEKSSLFIMLPSSDLPQVIEITNYVQANYGKALHIDQMAALFNMSERTFTRFFKKELGVTFIQYLKSVRITMAIELLVKTNLSVSEIANKVGYESLPSFSTTFYEFTGKRPKQFEKIQ